MQLFDLPLAILGTTVTVGVAGNAAAELLRLIPAGTVPPWISMEANPNQIKECPVDITNLQRRDATRIITDPGGDGDGGDSAHRTGIVAFCGSRLDQGLLPQFEVQPGIMVRHPTQGKWANPLNCSRDQLLAYVAGCWRCGRTDIAERLLVQHQMRYWTSQNTERDEPGTVKDPPIGDPIWPHEQMMIRICAGQRNAHLDLWGQTLLQASIDYAAEKGPEYEINQLLLEAVICSKLDYFASKVDYKRGLKYYWEKRQQSEISEALIEVVRIELERYNGHPSFVLPPLPYKQVLLLIESMTELYDALTHASWWASPSNYLKFPQAIADQYREHILHSLDQAEFVFDNSLRVFDRLGLETERIREIERDARYQLDQVVNRIGSAEMSPLEGLLTLSNPGVGAVAQAIGIRL